MPWVLYGIFPYHTFAPSLTKQCRDGNSALDPRTLVGIRNWSVNTLQSMGFFGTPAMVMVTVTVVVVTVVTVVIAVVVVVVVAVVVVVVVVIVVIVVVYSGDAVHHTLAPWHLGDDVLRVK